MKKLKEENLKINNKNNIHQKHLVANTIIKIIDRILYPVLCNCALLLSITLEGPNQTEYPVLFSSAIYL